jgi:hypothetical protein
MMKGLDLEKRRAWAARLERFRASGKTVAKFCEQEKVRVHTFYYWTRRIGAPSTAARVPRGARASADQSLAVDSRIHFQLGGGVVVSIPANCLAAIRCLVQCIQSSSVAAPTSSFHQVLLRDAEAS